MGIAFSLYHVFTSRQKTDWEKTCMLFFAVIINALAGISAGMHMLEGSHGLLSVFPIWNIMNGALLFLMYRFDIIDEGSIVDDNATLLQVIVGSVVVVFAFAICTFIFDMYWAITFSICVAYASNVNGVVQSIVLGTNQTHGEQNN